MIDFKDIVGHFDIIQHFQHSIAMDKVSQAYIINGETGSGKKTLARAFAKALQCEGEGDARPCCRCKSCLQCDSENHPDIFWVSHDKPNVITVDEVREQVNQTISSKPYSGRYKIYVVNDAHLMNANAQNSLLKTIEEPPEYAVILLLTASADKLLPTINSRCINLNVKPVSELEIRDYLTKELGLDETKAGFCVSFAQGNLGRAIRLATSDEYNEIKEDVIRILTNIPDMSVEDIIHSIKSMNHHKVRISDYIDMMTMWYRDILMFKVMGSADKLMFKEYVADIRSQSAHISYEGIENVIKAMNTAKVRLLANVNFDIAMELMLLTMKENR